MIRVPIIVSVLLAVIYYQSYNQDLGLSLCQLTVASYCQPEKLQSWTCEPCYNSQIRIENVQLFRNSSGEALGFIGNSINPSAIFVIFRGAQLSKLNQWYQGIDLAKVNYPLCNNGCQVHRQFYREYTDISTRVMNTVKEYMTLFQKPRVIVAGHSLGAAFATFAALQLINEGVSVTDLYTFGSPRLGDIRFAGWFDSYIKTNSKNRVTHARDSVPHIPSNVAGFHHTTHEIFYKGSLRDGYVSCTDGAMKQDGNCADKNFANVTLTDHLNYYDIDFTSVIMGCQN